jgi:hypothetical protein
MIKSFRGRLADGGQKRIRLSTKKGEIGYKIVKFQIAGDAPGTQAQESVVRLWKVKQSSVSTSAVDLDFSDDNLLAYAYGTDHDNPQYPIGETVIFEQEVFNQDIYITHSEMHQARACNYYLELEQVKLDINENTVATLKNIRNTTQ